VSAVLALFASPEGDAPATTEFLRVLAALRAVGVAVRLVECGRGAGVLSGVDRALSSEGDRYLAALFEDGVRVESDVDLAAALSSATAVVTSLDPKRSGLPPLLRLPRDAAPGSLDLSGILSAGQVALG